MAGSSRNARKVKVASLAVVITVKVQNNGDGKNIKEFI